MFSFRNKIYIKKISLSDIKYVNGPPVAMKRGKRKNKGGNHQERKHPSKNLSN